MGETASRLEGRTVGNYRIVRLLGAGAMGSVYLLEHVRLPNTFAAMKVLTPKRGNAELLRERFVQEALVAAAIGGHRVARPLDIGRLDDETPYIIMEYVDGRTLAEAIDSGGPLPLPAALTIAYRVAEAMAMAHARGIIHRDLKPSNLMLVDAQGDAQVKILDFGVARADGDIKIAQTLESVVIGSPGYMSPEAATGMIVDGKTDVFSLAVTLFKMLTGKLPFTGSSPREMLAGMLTQPPPRVSSLRPESAGAVARTLDQLVTRALHKDPGERPTMSELRDALFTELCIVAPARAATLRSDATPAPAPLPADADGLSSTLQGVGAADLRQVRELVERFAATRVPGSTALRRARPSRQFAVAAAVLALLATGALLIHQRLTARAPRPAPPARLPRSAPRAQQRQVTFNGDVRIAALSPDGKIAAYVSGAQLFLHDLDSDVERQVASDSDIDNVVWLPDGKSLVYSSGTSSAPHWTRIASDGQGPPLANDDDHGTPTYSPDGKQIARAYLPRKLIQIRDAAGGSLLRQIDLRGDITWTHAIEWSPRGDRLLVVTQHNTVMTPWLLTLDGAQQRPLALDDLFRAHFVDDGRALVYLRWHGGEPLFDVMLAPLDGDRLQLAGEPRALMSLRAAPSLAMNDRFSVSRDAQRMIYVGTESLEANLWTALLSPDGKVSAARQLTADTAGKQTPRLSPDGTRVAFGLSDGAHADLYVMPFSGGERRRVAHVDTDCLRPAWSPDGKQLAFRALRTTDLWIVDADGGARRKLKLEEPSGDDGDIVWETPSRILYHAEGNRSFRVLDPATGSVTRLSEDHGWYFDPTPSPDGRELALYWNREKPGLWTLSRVDGSQRLVLADYLSTPLGWSRDGKQLYFKRDHDRGKRDPLRILRVPAQGGAAQAWVTLPFSSAADCDLARDASRIVCSVPALQDDLFVVENFGALVAAAR